MFCITFLLTDNLKVHALINAKIRYWVETYVVVNRLPYVVIVFCMLSSSFIHHGYMLKVITFC